MATTPEGRIKKKVSALLDEYGPIMYYYMPVPGGYGKTTLDYIGAFLGRSFAIETKRPGKKPTARQEGVIQDMERAGIVVFQIDGEPGLIRLRAWLEATGRYPS